MNFISFERIIRLIKLFNVIHIIVTVIYLRGSEYITYSCVCSISYMYTYLANRGGKIDQNKFYRDCQMDSLWKKWKQIAEI